MIMGLVSSLAMDDKAKDCKWKFHRVPFYFLKLFFDVIVDVQLGLECKEISIWGQRWLMGRVLTRMTLKWEVVWLTIALEFNGLGA